MFSKKLPPPEIIDLQVEDPPLNKQEEHYFGKFQIEFTSNQELKIKFQFKRDLVSQDLQTQELEVIEREEYQLTQTIELLITNKELTASLKSAFGSVRKLADFLSSDIGNPQRVTIDRQKLCLRYGNNPEVQLFFQCYRKISRNQSIQDMKRFEETFSHFNELQLKFMDPDLLQSLGVGLLKEESFDLYKELQDQKQQESSVEEGSNEQSQFGQEQSEAVGMNQLSQGSTGQKNMSSVDVPGSNNFSFAAKKNEIAKQSEIPIYQRFRGLDINMPRREKVKLAQKMLRIGYQKDDIIRFFQGGAQQMQAQGHKIPDYRNPQTARYRYIHQIVAKRQNKRHNQLYAKHGLPHVPELALYGGQIFIEEQQESDLQIKTRQMLLGLLRERKLKRLDDIQIQMKRRGVDVTVPYLKKLVEQIKQKSQQRKSNSERLSDEIGE